MDQLTFLLFLAVTCGLGAGLYWLKDRRRKK